jgi:hypothetical protein
LIGENNEDDAAWNEWGTSLLNLSQVMRDPAHPELTKPILEEAEVKLMRAAALGNVQSLYQLACVYSLTDRYELAIDFIERAGINGSLPSFDQIMSDQWLEGLRNTDQFRHFLIQKTMNKEV